MCISLHALHDLIDIKTLWQHPAQLYKAGHENYVSQLLRNVTLTY